MNTKRFALSALIAIASAACGDNITNIYTPNSGGPGGSGGELAIGNGGDGGAGGSAGAGDSASSSSSTTASSVGAGGDIGATSSSSDAASSSSSDAASSSSSGEPEVCFTDCGGLGGWTQRGAHCGPIPKCGGGTLDCGGCGSPMWCNKTFCECLPDSNSQHTCPGASKPSRCGAYDAVKVPADCSNGDGYWCCGPV